MISVSLEGDFEENAVTLLRQIAPTAVITQDAQTSDVGVYDRMDDSEEPSAFDKVKLATLVGRCRSVIFFANGLVEPDVSKTVTVIGYKPGSVSSRPPRVFWNLRYAPVTLEQNVQDATIRDRSRAFVALGTARGIEGLRKVLLAMSEVRSITSIDVLGSPLNPIGAAINCIRPDQVVRVHEQVADVAPFLFSAGLVVASYGHLGYEALACGAPLCLVGQKVFQAQYAERLAARGMCIAAGSLTEITSAGLARKFEETLRCANALSRTARSNIDGHGLDRIAELILTRLEAA